MLSNLNKKYRYLLIYILLLTLAFSGCASKETEQPKTTIPTLKTEVKEVDLQQIIEETSVALSTTWTPYTIDEFLSFLDQKKARPVVVEDTGAPVSVRLVYPSRFSLIDRPVKFIASAVSENGKIDQVVFYLDGEKVAELKNPPYSFDFNPEAYAKSEHTLKVVAKSGKYSDQDTIKFYNVIKGSIVIYPWKPSAGNIPYSYVNNYYQPDGSSIEAAMFTAYYNSNFFLDFKRRLKPGYSYLLGKVYLDGIIVADQQSETLFARFFNYATKKFDGSHLYEWELGQQPSEGPEKVGEAYSYNPVGNTGQYAGSLMGSMIPFYGFNPLSKEFCIRIEGKGPTKFFVKPIVVEYYAVEDKKPPTIRYRTAYLSGTTVTCEFYVSEPVIATIYAYDGDGKVRSLTEPKMEGWVEIEIADSNTRFVSIKVMDGAGFVSTLPKRSVIR